MMTDMIEETLEAKLKRHEDALVACMAEIERLRAENSSLKANNASAHQTLRAIYADSTQPATVRVRAAQAALNVETPSLKPQPPAIDATCEEIIPLPQLVEERRARMIKAHAEDPQFRGLPSFGRDDGNGQDDDTAAG
jgi:hypothetical protein